MFISTKEKLDLIHAVQLLTDRVSALEKCHRSAVVIDKKTLLEKADAVRAQKIKQREYSKRYYQKTKKAAQ